MKDVGTFDSGDTSVQSEDSGEPSPDPTLISLVLSPDPVTTDELLIAEATTDDGTGASTEVRWSWSVNGEEVEETRAELAGDTWFEKGDTVDVFATPFVDDAEGESLTASIVVSNTPPSAPTVEIVPGVPIEGEDALLCTVSVEATDADSADASILSYVAGWTVDGVAYGAATETSFAGDTVSETATTAGETWECTVTPSDDEADGPTGSDSVVIDEFVVPVAECSDSLGSLSSSTEVVTVSGGGSPGIGTWMSDADPAEVRGQQWVMMDYEDDQVSEYDSYADLVSGTISRTISLDDDWHGTGHVVLSGVLYYNEEDSSTLVALDLATEVELAREDLPDAGYANTYPYSYGGNTDIDFSVDGTSLYIIYSTDSDSGRIVVSELDPDTLLVLDTWTAPSATKSDFTNTFLACGVLYGVDSEADGGSCFYCADTTVDYAWNLSTGVESDIEIDFTAPGSLSDGGYIGSVNYNPADGMIYVLRGGILGLMEPTWD